MEHYFYPPEETKWGPSSVLSMLSLWPMFVCVLCFWNVLGEIPNTSLFLFSENKKAKTPYYHLQNHYGLASPLPKSNNITYPLARLSIAQYWSTSCWHFLEILLQLASSDLSPQSLSPLQRSLRLTHLPGMKTEKGREPTGTSRHKHLPCTRPQRSLHYTVLRSPCESDRGGEALRVSAQRDRSSISRRHFWGEIIESEGVT